MARTAPDDLPGLKAGGKAALAGALTEIELRRGTQTVVGLLDQAWRAPAGIAIGFTGPPGVGKSSLIHKLIALWRGRGRTVGVLAIDPSSRRTGGALLGDRTRMKTDPEDQGVFLRSMAARDRLGGLSDLAFPAVVLMRAIFDRVLVETVGVGQSETDITGVADLTMLCVQPGAGDSLQFMKAGIAEVPDCVVVTKSDLKALAGRAVADVEGALGLAADGLGSVRVFAVSSAKDEGLEALADWADGEASRRALAIAAARDGQARAWMAAGVREAFGRKGEAAARSALEAADTARPFTEEIRILGSLRVVGGAN